MKGRARTSIYGVGINDSPIPTTNVTINGKHYNRCPFYLKWKKMLEICYSPKSITYGKFTVCKEWLHLSNFSYWMSEQDWEGKVLDKTILAIDNTHYSPETCCFVNSTLNKVLTYGGVENELLLGVKRNKVCYSARLKNGTGKEHYIGTFKTIEEAHKEYKKAKYNHLISLAEEQLTNGTNGTNDTNRTKDARIRDGLIRHANEYR